jgi:PQQ-dependent catabolism-associated CXXCW motif protein
VIHTKALKALLRQGSALPIDVLPAPRRPEGMRPDQPWMPVPRRDIPGSLWLPDVGRGELAAGIEAYFRSNLARAAKGRRDTPVVFYCLADCWMSWNASKRAAGWGYTRIYWYRDGTDGWQAAKLPLARAEPAPGFP